MPQGFGCMGFSAFYGSAAKTTPEAAKGVITLAMEKGVTLFNTANFYGPLNEVGYGANLRLLKSCFEGIDRSKFQVMVKICMNTRCPVEKTGTQWLCKGDAATVKEDVDYALQTLGLNVIDIVVLCRVPQNTAIEETVAAMQEVVKEGKARHIGLSEASAEIIRRAHAIAPIYCIEQEWSLWSRDIEASILPTCRELGIKIVAYSPLGRGFLTGTIRSRDDSEKFGERDMRLSLPRYSEENMPKNLAAVDAVNELAKAKNCTVGQLALAFLHAQGEDVIPIPGTTKQEHLLQNLAARDITLSKEDLAKIDAIFPPVSEDGQNSAGVAGDRYAHMAMTYVGNKTA